MNKTDFLKRTIIGLSFFLVSILLIIGFAAHPKLLSLDVMDKGQDFANEFRNNHLLEVGHIGVMFSGFLFIGIMSGFYKMLRDKSPVLSFGVLIFGIFGSFMLGVDKGALALVPSAFNTLPDEQFAVLTPGLEAMIQYKGYMWLAQLYLFIPVAMILAGIGFLKTNIIPTWQSIALIAGSLLFFNPDIDLLSLIASVVISFALIPIGFSFLRNKHNIS
ncbi:DUF4386 family protein [Mariniphaga sediminis]|uniref:DUF4386 family protein n=1 Tax=Mariniphaga sediminis TaxID=1628158 RepID=A0A399D109_9BACT|nr:DUF4386 family protein [Mariniphaga sediminis]RIH65116.1 DUF4386 family protein [Mariniphaga sediminis]